MAARLTDHDDASRDDDEFSAVFSYFDSSYSSEDDTPDDDKPLEEPKETVVKKTKPLTYEKRRTATTIYHRRLRSPYECIATQNLDFLQTLNRFND